MFKIEIFENLEEISENLRNFLEKNERSLVFQSDLWMGFVEKHFKNRKSFFVFIKNERDEILLYSLIFKIRLFRNQFYFYSPFGPIFDFARNKEAFSYFIQEVDKLAEKEKICFFRCDPQVSYDDVFLNSNFISSQNLNQENLNSTNFKNTNLLTSLNLVENKLKAFEILLNFFTKENNLVISQEQRQPENLYILNLEKSEAEILALMKEKGRYNLKQAIKKGIVVEKTSDVDAPDFQSFYDLMTETMRRNGLFSEPKSFFADIIKSLKGKIFLFSAKKDGRVLASAITSFFGEKAIYHYGASTSDKNDRKLMAPYLLQFEMIKEAKQNLCKTYDFLGVSPEILEMKEKFYILEGLKKYEFKTKKEAEFFLENHKFKGITDFKQKFGGETKSFIGTIEKVYDKKTYFIYNLLKNWRKKLRRILKVKI